MNEEMRESPRGKSMISLYSDCPRKWAWKYLKGFKPIQTPDYLIFGSCIHEAQEVFYKTWDIEKAVKRAVEFMGEATMPDEWRIPLLDKAVFTMRGWYEELGKYDMENCDVLAVEEESSLTLPNGFVMSMRWDRVLLDRIANEIFVSDTKTTGWSYNSTISGYMVSSQPILYIGSVIENRPEWTDRLSGWRTDCLYVKPLKRGGYSHEFGRSEPVRHSPAELDDCKRSYATYTSGISYALDGVEKHGESIGQNFPRNFGNCTSFGKRCPFIPICHRIDDISTAPEGMEIDPWLEERVVLDSFTNIE